METHGSPAPGDWFLVLLRNQTGAVRYVSFAFLLFVLYQFILLLGRVIQYFNSFFPERKMVKRFTISPKWVEAYAIALLIGGIIFLGLENRFKTALQALESVDVSDR